MKEPCSSCSQKPWVQPHGIIDFLDFSFTIIRRPYRRTLTISISTDNKVKVYASKGTTQGAIQKFLFENQNWINKTLQRNAKVRGIYLKRQYVDGDKILYMGKKLSIKLEPGLSSKIELTRRILRIHIPLIFHLDQQKSFVLNQLIKWYKTVAEKLLPARLDIYAKRLNVTPNQIRIRTLKSMWGSCSSKKQINLNWKLVMAPIPIIDYIIVHELCHLNHLNHSSKFWKFVESVIPNHKECRKWLRENEPIFIL